MGRGRPRRTAEERFWTKVEKTETCWLWTGTLDRAGYGHIFANGRTQGVHRYAHELLIGPIPAGMEIDHVRLRGCLNRHCVNPAHLEAVTPLENILRAYSEKSPPRPKRAVSLQEILIYRTLKHASDWLTNRQIAEQSGVCVGTVTATTRRYEHLGICDRVNSWHAMLFQISGLAGVRSGAYLDNLELCASALEVEL